MTALLVGVNRDTLPLPAGRGIADTPQRALDN